MPTRLAVFSIVDWAFAVVHGWADSEGHEIALLVTRPATGPAPGLQDMTQVGPDTVVMAAADVRTCETTLSELEVDLAVVFTSLRIPESVAVIPRHGCVNLHPSPLPAYRGANGFRSLYEGEPRRSGRPCTTSPPSSTPVRSSPSLPSPLLRTWSQSALRRRCKRSPGTVSMPRSPPGARWRPRGGTGCFCGDGRPGKFTEDETMFVLALPPHLFQCRFSPR